MAVRVTGKAKKDAQKALPGAARDLTASGADDAVRANDGDRIGELEAECARLNAELAAANARIKALDAQRELLINRIDWVIDSLHSLRDE